MKLLDRWLDRITMYRLLLYVLIAIEVAAVVLSALGYLHYNPWSVAFSAAILVLVCWSSNAVFAYVFKAPTNQESSYLTALILALIVTPVQTTAGVAFLVAVGGLATASKYLLAIKRQHVFNPAAIAVVLTGLGASQAASWWVGNSYLWPVVLVGGLLVMHKIRRTKMVLTFMATASAATVILAFGRHASTVDTLERLVTHSSLLFLGFIMLTEPLTSPTTPESQLWYAGLVGVLFPPQIHLGSIYSTPELTLIVGNVFNYFVSPHLNLLPKFKERHELTSDTADFIFATARPVRYQPGQYMEWTLPHHGADNRGNRRYFTLASSPTEPDLRLGVKFYPDGSSYKRAMLTLTPQTSIAAHHLGGSFTLPSDPKRKLAFIAGGIGVTPYRSMVKYLLDTSERRDITLIYSERRESELVYRDVFEAAVKGLGLKLVYTLTEETLAQWKGSRGPITAELIKTTVPDYAERLFYLSGPHPMVQAMKKALRQLGVPRRQIKVDFFPGYA